MYVKVDEQKINADTILGFLNSKVLQYKKVSFDHVLFWVFVFLPTQIRIKSSSWRHHNTWREKPESFELLLHNGNPATLGNLGFHLSNLMNVNGCRLPLNRFPDSAHTGDQRVGTFSLSLLFWQFKK